jgi:hypothetical protein
MMGEGGLLGEGKRYGKQIFPKIELLYESSHALTKKNINHIIEYTVSKAYNEVKLSLCTP